MGKANNLLFANAMLGETYRGTEIASSPTPPLKKTNPKEYAKKRAQKQSRKQSRKVGKRK